MPNLISDRVRKILKGRYDFMPSAPANQKRDEYIIKITAWANDPAVGEAFVNKVVDHAMSIAHGLGIQGPEIDTSYFEKRMAKMTEDEVYGEQTGTLIYSCWDEEGTKEYPAGTEVFFEGSVEELMRQYMGGLIEDVRLPDGSYRRLEPDAVSWHAIGI